MNGNAPLVSIVIPAYNHADYLERAIESVLGQDYPNVELLVFDDGSTDHTREVLEKYASRFHCETHENMGQAATLNKGWKMAGGEILGYLSSDDVLLPDAISNCVNHLLANPNAVMTYGDYNLVGVDLTLIRRVHAPQLTYRDMVVKIVNPVGPGALFRRDAFEAAGPWNDRLRLSPDYDFWLRLGLQGEFSKVPRLLSSMRVHSESPSFAAVDEARSEEFVRVISDYYELQEVPADVLAAKKEALSNAYIFAARSHLRSGRYARGLARLAKGLYLYPGNLSKRTARILAHGFLNHVRYKRYVRRSDGGARTVPGQPSR